MNGRSAFAAGALLALTLPAGGSEPPFTVGPPAAWVEELPLPEGPPARGRALRKTLPADRRAAPGGGRAFEPLSPLGLAACACGSPSRQEPAGREGLRYGGQPLVVVTRACARCSRPETVYVRWQATTRPGA